MLFKEINTVYTEKHTKLINTVSRQNSNYWLLEHEVHAVMTGFKKWNKSNIDFKYQILRKLTINYDQ
jgi:hypothetical protein